MSQRLRANRPRETCSPFVRRAALLALALLLVPHEQQAIAADNSSSPATIAENNIRVRVAPRELHGRKRDECPAELKLTSSDLPAGTRIDLSTLQVFRVDPNSRHPSATSLPLRWYDDCIAYDFPECEQNVHRTDGRHLQYESRPRWGDFYNLVGEGRGGRLVWLHSQEQDRPAEYEIRFHVVDATSKSSAPSQAKVGRSPRGFVGDGSHRCALSGGSSTEMIHSRVTVADIDGDGATDLIIGGARGAVLAYPNAGSKNKPTFPSASLLLLADGKPIDVGWSAAPLAVDWDGDGRTDLVCGAERNRILFYRSLGKPRSTGRAAASDAATGCSQSLPRFELKGFVEADGKPIVLPTSPVPEGGGIFNLDYYPVLDAPDWNGDGRRDLLAGGFITGRVYYYECVGQNPDGTPQLAFRDAVLADGQPLDVGWAAAPCAADFDGDGDLDLVCGNMPMTAAGADASSAKLFLRYYENIGTRTNPRLTERPFPKVGDFPDSALGTPRAVDINGDGLLDLVVSASESVFIYENVGTKHETRFAVHSRPLPTEWGGAPLPTFGVQVLDVDGDGRLDLLNALSVYRNEGHDQFRRVELLPSGSRIEHPARHGDPWIFTQLADMDGDGERDLLYGTHDGNIFLHRKEKGTYAEQGEMLRQTDGQPVHVGPVPGQALDFDVLQGARTTFVAADFDSDGLLDLAVGDTYGKLRYFRNAGTRTAPRFERSVELGDMKIRVVPCAADWDHDGRLDIIGSAASGSVALFRNKGSKGDGTQFAPAEPLAIPPTPYSPVVTIADWNGDGDDDVIVGTSYGFFCWFERSFLDHGYARAQRLPAPSDR